MVENSDNVQLWVSRSTRKLLREIQIEHDDKNLMEVYEMVAKEWLELDKAMKSKGLTKNDVIRLIMEK